MRTFHWILGALGAAALALPGAALADGGKGYDKDKDADVTVEGNGDSATLEGDGGAAWEDEEFEAEGDGSATFEEERIEGDGDGVFLEEEAVEGDGDRAQVEGEGTSAYDYQAAAARAERERRGPDKGVQVQAQGGIISFPGEAASQLSPGALYGVVVGIEPPIPVFELELGYQGGAYQSDERLTGAQENVIENGGQALLKASPEVGAFEPYVFGGYQISRFNVYERANSTGALQDDTLHKAPVGAGFDVHLGDVLLGARGSYNFIFGNDAFTNIPTQSSDRDADQLTGSLLLGGQF